jgi:hypothetical protein
MPVSIDLIANVVGGIALLGGLAAIAVVVLKLWNDRTRLLCQAVPTCESNVSKSNR